MADRSLYISTDQIFAYQRQAQELRAEAVAAGFAALGRWIANRFAALRGGRVNAAH